MKLIESKAEYIPQEEGLEGVYKQIELAGRTCYKSEDKITEDSDKGFVERMTKSSHTAMLEHGTVYLSIPMIHSDIIYKYEKNRFSKVGDAYNGIAGDWQQYPVTTNYRVIVENNWLDDLQFVCAPTKFHEKRYTLKFITDRGVSHELIRHRVFSFAQESTRYCNYSKDKFGNELTFCAPSWLSSTEYTRINSEERIFFRSCEHAEYDYLRLISKGWKPQQARAVLPNATKTEIIMTGFTSDWRHLMDLRLFGKTGAVHPDMKDLMQKAQKAMQEANIWEDIIKYPSKFREDDNTKDIQ